MAGFAVNGRFLGVTSPTGVQRVARSLLTAALPLLEPDARVVAPKGVSDPLITEHVGHWRGPVSGLAWEQATFVAAARNCAAVSLANTAPVLGTRASAVLIHDLAPLTNPAWFHRRMGLYARVALASARRADVVFAVSHHVAGVLVSSGVRAERIRVVRPCVDSGFRPTAEAEVIEVLSTLGIATPYVVQVGAGDPRKNAAMLARAHLSVVGSHPHQLVLVGGRHPNLAVASVPKASSIVDVGRLDERSLRAVLTGASALAYPSFDEGFGLPPLEAQGCGTPAIVSDIAALRESAGPTAVRIGVRDMGGWAAALVAAVHGALPPPTPSTRTWAETAAEFVESLRTLA